MKTTLFPTAGLLASTLLVCTSPAHAASLWETDYDSALAKAKQENRFLLLDFSGSDWCRWCIKLDQEIFVKKPFKEFAEENLVCVLIDSPRRKKLSDELQTQNTALKQKFGVRRFPAVLVLSPAGEVIGRTGYQRDGPEAFVEHLEDFIEPHRDKYPSILPKSSDVRQVTSNVRTWTAQSGMTVDAALVEAGQGWVRLRRDDGSMIKIRVPKLSEADQAYLQGE